MLSLIKTIFGKKEFSPPKTEAIDEYGRTGQSYDDECRAVADAAIAAMNAGIFSGRSEEVVKAARAPYQRRTQES